MSTIINNFEEINNYEEVSINVTLNLSEVQKCWLQDELDELIEEHRGAASNEHIWALGSYDDEEAAQHEAYCDENRGYAEILQHLRDLIKPQ